MQIVDIKKKLKSIKKEVDEFHPILDSLFSKLPSISHVDYTQGPHEKGADFILTKPHSELGGVDYIGVLVKVGKIKATDTDVARQIEECKLKRYVENGKKQIHLDEIWVTSNDKVTENAKDKINQTYNGQKIKYLDLDQLSDLIAKYNPNWLSDLHIKDSDFLLSEQSRAEKKDKISNLLPDVDYEIYLPQKSLSNVLTTTVTIHLHQNR